MNAHARMHYIRTAMKKEQMRERDRERSVHAQNAVLRTDQCAVVTVLRLLREVRETCTFVLSARWRCGASRDLMRDGLEYVGDGRESGEWGTVCMNAGSRVCQHGRYSGRKPTSSAGNVLRDESGGRACLVDIG